MKILINSEERHQFLNNYLGWWLKSRTSVLHRGENRKTEIKSQNLFSCFQ